MGSCFGMAGHSGAERLFRSTRSKVTQLQSWTCCLALKGRALTPPGVFSRGARSLKFWMLFGFVFPRVAAVGPIAQLARARA